MSNYSRTIWLAVAGVVAIALASIVQADTVYRSGRAKGVTWLTVEASSGQDIYEVHLKVVRGKVKAYRVPEGWFGEAYGGEMLWRTDECAIADGSSLPGFGIKVTGKGLVAYWETRNVDGDLIDWGFVKLKGRP